jgi:hypothetical protein
MGLTDARIVKGVEIDPFTKHAFCDMIESNLGEERMTTAIVIYRAPYRLNEIVLAYAQQVNALKQQIAALERMAAQLERINQQQSAMLRSALWTNKAGEPRIQTRFGRAETLAVEVNAMLERAESRGMKLVYQTHFSHDNLVMSVLHFEMASAYPMPTVTRKGVA